MNKPKHRLRWKLSLLVKFSLISFFLMAAIAFVLAWGIQWHLEKVALQQEAEHAAEQVTTILGQNLRLADLSGPLDPNRYAQIDKLIRKNIMGRHTVRVKIWNRDGLEIGRAS